MGYGIVVTVSCSEDRQLRGDEVITCDQGVNFQFQEKPKCNDIGMCDPNLFEFAHFSVLLLDGSKNLEIVFRKQFAQKCLSV